MQETQTNNLLNKKVGAMLVATGILSRVMALREYALQQFEITPEQYLVLSIIMDSGTELYQRQISEITYKDRPNITRIINILENLGLVKRIEDVNKRKVYKIAITEKGIEMRKKIQPTMFKLRAITTQGISEEELEKTLQILEKMQINMADKVTLQI
ncbi:MAG: winged helix-turn-helix transcriptional regulator [Clostridium sp.]|nr:winged helix-turn-helix transcriptional regulator [Clostridium sp.]